ncbi:hypothetical protein [Runella zeae]|uniref:hypothetical protein n=1 Tax=Runella zeae TaxID=94255 RepID=UPI002355271A|nr:hypothetical protein [Runella zeae]
MKKEPISVQSILFAAGLVQKIEEAAKPVLYWHKQLRKHSRHTFFGRLRYAYAHYRFTRAQTRYFNTFLTLKSW